ncbi:MAG: hypothetical protein Q9217_007070 [Psora testacea]
MAELESESHTAPFAKLSVMRKIGLRRSGFAWKDKTGLRTWDDERRDMLSVGGAGAKRCRLASVDERGAEDEEVEEEVDVGDARAEPESKGFRRSIKTAVRKWIERRESSAEAAEAEVQNLRGRGRGLEEEGDGSGGSEDEDLDMALWRALNEEVLRQASEVPLPGVDGMDGLGLVNDEIDTVEEVAVTEEAADLGAADVILSV